MPGSRGWSDGRIGRGDDTKGAVGMIRLLNGVHDTSRAQDWMDVLPLRNDTK